MGLRKQLLLVSSVTLALPWAGLQMLHELEKALTEGQQNALAATARALFSARAETDAQGHLGLGLYMVRLIAQHHGGRVRAFNDPKTQKVVFELVLPGLR